MFKRAILLGAVSGLLAGLACLVYQKVYASSLGYDFAEVAKPVSIVISCVVAGIMVGILFALLKRWMPKSGEIVFNFILTILTLVSIVAPFAVKLPLEMEAPELFPGLVVPMHFFPALAWFTLRPLFVKYEVRSTKYEEKV